MPPRRPPAPPPRLGRVEERAAEGGAPAKTAINPNGSAKATEGKSSGAQTMRSVAGPEQQLEFSGGGSQGLSFKRA